MDRIEERLGQLIDEQHGVTVMLSQKARNRYIQRRDALRNEIAADFRAMVAALEGMLAAAIDGDYSYDEHGGEWPEIVQARAALARVKGE